MVFLTLQEKGYSITGTKGQIQVMYFLSKHTRERDKDRKTERERDKEERIDKKGKEGEICE